MKNARNPYGDGNSSKKILDAILGLYKDNKLKISVPENIMKKRTRKLIKVNENIKLRDFEKINDNLRVNIVFEEGNPLYPHDELNLKNKLLLVDQFID